MVLDPLTEEDVTSDWDVTVLVAVVLDPTDEMLTQLGAATQPTTPPATQTPAK